MAEQMRAPPHFALVGRQGIDRPTNLEPLPGLLHRLALDLHVDFGLVAGTRRTRLRAPRVGRAPARRAVVCAGCAGARGRRAGPPSPPPAKAGPPPATP